MTEPTKPRRSRKTVPDEATAAAYDAAWQANLPAQGSTWTARPWVNPEERAARGKEARKRVPRKRELSWPPRSSAIPASS